jgi:hypothetical protein
LVVRFVTCVAVTPDANDTGVPVLKRRLFWSVVLELPV